MKFLLDENFPKAVVPILESMGHEVEDFRVSGVVGSPDDDVLRAAKELSAVILTTDRDYFHTLGQNLSGHCGIIVVALRQPTRAAIISKIEWFIVHLGLHRLKGRAFQLRDRSWMDYPPLGD